MQWLKNNKVQPGSLQNITSVDNESKSIQEMQVRSCLTFNKFTADDEYTRHIRGNKTKNTF